MSETVLFTDGAPVAAFEDSELIPNNPIVLTSLDAENESPSKEPQQSALLTKMLRLSPDEKETALQRAIDHFGLVKGVVARFMRRGTVRPFEDLESDGHYGLLDAALTYVPGKGDACFEAYARIRIAGAIRDGYRSYFGGRKYENYREPSVFLPNVIALDASIDGTQQDADNLISLFPDNSPLPEELIIMKDETTQLHEAIRSLPERDQQIIQMSYFENRTLAEVGKALGVSESRVSQLRSRAIGNLRSSLHELNKEDFESQTNL
ncbi:MAG TPA: sigma-70 family RNA polymerase sigma factor [Candidatus Saccharimonadales bacterium]|nr:sigma-70 family RNA polymerase sigma factor [Candidatus Saccharimonadales bacterium]